jgi:hypothetical protein
MCSLTLKEYNKLQVFVVDVFRNILLHNKDKVIEKFWMLFEKSSGAYSSPSIVWIVKTIGDNNGLSMWLGWGCKEYISNFGAENLHLGNRDEDARVILK